MPCLNQNPNIWFVADESIISYKVNSCMENFAPISGM